MVVRNRRGSQSRATKSTSRSHKARLLIEDLEQRLLLTNNPPAYPDYITGTAPATTPLEQAEAAAVRDIQGPTLTGQNGPLAKIGLPLAEVYEEHLLFDSGADGSSSGTFVPSNPELQIQNNEVELDASASSNVTALDAELTALGMTVQSTTPQVVSGMFPIDKLNSLAAVSGLQFARADYKPIFSAGSVDSQGDQALNAPEARSQFGVDGTGITVGIISDSFNTSGDGNAAADVASGDLPAAGVKVLGDMPDGTDEGRGMAQIVHDVAPGAAIDFDTAGESDSDMAASINALQAAGSQVIADDVLFPDEPFFQDGVIAQAVDSVVGKGVAYFSAAGNDAAQSYQAPFTPSNQTGPMGGVLQNFAGTSGGVVTQQTVTVPLGDDVSFFLQWNQPFQSLGGTGATSQINIYLLDDTGTPIFGFGGSDPVLGSDPMQEFDLINDGSEGFFGSPTDEVPETQFTLEIELVSGTAPTMVKYIAEDDADGAEINTFNTNSSTDVGHANAAGAIGVAAAPYFATPAFGVSPPELEDFSSEGGTPIYYDSSGTLLKIPEIRQSPAVTGPDGVNTSFFDPTEEGESYPSNPVPFNFFGTSAATPHVAAVAALMLQAAGGPGSLTPAQIRTDLENSATPITTRVDYDDVSDTTQITSIPGPNGYNYFAGFGLVDADKAVESVKSTSTAPVAVNDTATTNENTPVAISVLANDTPGTNPITTMTIVGQPAHGTVSIDPQTGIVTYTPANNFSGSDSFTYTIGDSAGNVSNVATVSITVVSTTAAPTAVNDTATTNENTPVAISVLANDVPGTSPIAPGTVAIVGQPGHGTVSVNPQTGVVTYTPANNFSGNDTFTYTVSDSTGNVSNIATVSITVLLVASPPVAVDDTATTIENIPTAINVLANDIAGSSPLAPSTVAIVAEPSHGTVSVNTQTGLVTYTPANNFSGNDSFTYTVSGSDGTVSNVATVSITVAFVDQPPVAVDDVAATQRDEPVTINVLANDFSAGAALMPSSLTIIQQPVNGTATIVNNQIVYTPKPGYIGGDSLKYVVSDTFGKLSNVANVAIRIGDPVEVSGFAYVDTNGDGVKDSGEVGIPGVTVELTKTDGNDTFSEFTLTGADGSYHFIDGSNYVLPTGIYTIKEIQPGFFIPGTATMGTPAAAGPNSNSEFDNITLAPDQQATNYDFGSKGVSAEFVAAYLNRQAFFASSSPTLSGLNLAAGPNWVSFDSGVQGTLSAVAQFDATQGNVTMTLFDSSLKAVATSTSAGGVSELSFTGQSTSAYFLEVTGTNPNVAVTSYVPNAPVITSSPVAPFQNTLQPLDVNDDGTITALDALIVINQLNAGKGGVLSELSGLGSNFVDVNGDGSLTALDALTIINELNAKSTLVDAAQAGNSQAGDAAAQATPIDTSPVAFALDTAQTSAPSSTAAASGAGNVSLGGTPVGSAVAGSTTPSSSLSGSATAAVVPASATRPAIRPTSAAAQLADLVWTDEEAW